MTETPANYPTILTGVTTDLGRRSHRNGAESFGVGLAKLAEAEAEGLLTKSEHEWLKAAFNNTFEHAFQALVAEPYYNAGKYQDLTSEERELEMQVAHPACHLANGYLKRVEKFTTKFPNSTIAGAMLSFYKEAGPLGVRVSILKGKIGKRAPKPTKTSIAEAERASLAMTCQCCGSDVLANTGLIAHHGYQRPGQGWQTASCPGARELPFEVSRDALGSYIDALKAAKAREETFLQAVVDEAHDLRWTFADLSTKTQPWIKAENKTVEVNRATFDAVFAETESIRAKSTLTYDLLKADKISRIRGDIRNLASEITLQTGRYEGWKGVTHERQGDAWVKL